MMAAARMGPSSSHRGLIGVVSEDSNETDLALLIDFWALKFSEIHLSASGSGREDTSLLETVKYLQQHVPSKKKNLDK